MSTLLSDAIWHVKSNYCISLLWNTKILVLMFLSAKCSSFNWGVLHPDRQELFILEKGFSLLQLDSVDHFHLRLHLSKFPRNPLSHPLPFSLGTRGPLLANSPEARTCISDRKQHDLYPQTGERPFPSDGGTFNFDRDIQEGGWRRLCPPPPFQYTRTRLGGKNGTEFAERLLCA